MEIQNVETQTNLRSRSKFQQLYPILKSELLQSSPFQHDSHSHQWIEQMLDYNVPGGKLNRGISVVETYILLNRSNEEDEDEQKQLQVQLFRASVLGWCIQWLVGCVLVLDDILDNSVTRRGRVCWFRRPEVGMIAVNDGVLLWNHIHWILKTHFCGQRCYVDLLDLFNEVEFQTASGEMLDLIIGDRRDLSLFTPENLRRISKYKTAYGTFYLPFACAMLLLSDTQKAVFANYESEIKDILVEMGVYFQVQDDYLDCYGNLEKTGKVGSDIQDFKCCWLIVKALELSNEEQRKKLCENYGKVEEECVEIVKEVYREVELERVYGEYEIEVYEKIVGWIEKVPSDCVQDVLKAYLGKIHKRQK